MALTIESILPAEQTKIAGETIEITTVASGGLRYGDGGLPYSNGDWFLSQGAGNIFTDRIELGFSQSGSRINNTIPLPRDFTFSYKISHSSGYYFRIQILSEKVFVDSNRNEVFLWLDSSQATLGIYVNNALTTTDVPITFAQNDYSTVEVVGQDNNYVVTMNYYRSNGEFVQTETIPFTADFSQVDMVMSATQYQGVSVLSDVSLSVPISYQYNKDGSPITGAESATYTKTAEEGDSGSYTCTVSDGVDTLTSDAVSVVVASQDTPENYLANNISDYEPNYSQNVSFTLLSSGDIRVVDRGEITDTYTTTLEYIGSGDELVSIVNFLRNNLEFEMPATDVRIFGDHISNTDSAFNVSVMDITPLVATSVNTQSFEITLALVAPYLYSPVVSVLPSMTCVNPTYERLFVDGYSVASTYGSDYFTNDSERIYRSFKGQYKLTTEATSELLYMWANVFRGSTIAITDGDFGVVDMFGDGGTSHNVIVEDVVVQRDGYEYRDVEIKLIKVG